MTAGSIKRVLKMPLLKACKTLGLFWVSRYLRKRKLLILCYHGFEICDEVAFRPRLFISNDVFARRLDTIRMLGFNVLPLDRAIRQLRQNTLPDNSVCITVDDGFYSTLACAAPILQRYGYPATLYVTSYYVSKNSPVFRLVVQYMFWKTNCDILDVGNQPWGPQGVIDLRIAEAKDRAMWAIIEFGESRCDEPSRKQISITLGSCLKVDYESIEQSRILSLLTPMEISQLSDTGIDVQLHTHRHRLPADDQDAVRREVTENANFLEAILGHRLDHLCYPSGEWHQSQWPWLSNLGVRSATTCDPGLNTKDTSTLALYRVLDDSAVSQLDFEAELCGFSELIRLLTGRRRILELKRREWVKPLP